MKPRDTKPALELTDRNGDRLQFETGTNISIVRIVNSGGVLRGNVLLEFPQLFALKEWVNDVVASHVGNQPDGYIRRYET